MSTFSDEQLDAAVKALSDPERFREAEQVVARAAPELQRILTQALESGGWFAEGHGEGLRRALETEDPDARATELRTLLAEEARIGMMVGVAVGWALATELSETTPEG